MLRWLGHGRIPFVLPVLAVALTLPSLWAGWVADDHHHRFRIVKAAVFEQIFPDSSNGLMDLFAFADGDPAQDLRAMDLGFWPWWTYDGIRASFFRPLASATHWLDYRCWPDHPGVMHAQSLLWFAGLIWAVTTFFRRIIGPTWVAGLAALLYAVDDARALPAGWLANRNAAIAALLGVLALIAHDRWRRDRWRAGIVAGPLLLAVSLLSKEAGVATCAYLFAYAVCLDPGRWSRGLLALLPYGVVVLVWRVVWSAMGYGVYGLFLYVDPLVEPIRYLATAIERAPIFLLGQWLLPPSDLYIAHPLVGGVTVYCLAASAIVALIGWLVVRRVEWNSVTRFWAFGMVLALVPICAVFPSDRLLSFVGLGASALLAQFLAGVFVPSDTERPARLARRSRVAARTLGVAFIVVHLCLSPLVLAVRSWMPMGPPEFLERIQVHVAMGEEVQEQSVVIVTAPLPLVACYLAERRAVDDLPIPAHTRVLSPYQSTSVLVNRLDERTLVIRPAHGFVDLPFERLARSEQHPMTVGQRVELTGMTATVTELTVDGYPAEARFTFSVPLEDSSLRWLVWRDGTYVPFVPPAVGATVDLATSPRDRALPDPFLPSVVDP